MSNNVITFGTLSSDALSPTFSELSRRLQCPTSQISFFAELYTDTLRQKINCKYAFSKFPILALSEEETEFSFGKIKSKDLAYFLKECSSIAVFAVTLGIGADREIAKLSPHPADAFIVDGIASAMVEAAADEAQRIITGKEPPYARFSPGYGDFDIAYQPLMLDVLNAQRLLGITLNKSLLMTPTKTITAIVGINDEA